MQDFIKTPSGTLVRLSTIGTVKCTGKHFAITDKNMGALIDYLVCPQGVGEAFRDALIDLILNPAPKGAVVQPDWVAIAVRVDPEWATKVGWTAEIADGEDR